MMRKGITITLVLSLKMVFTWELERTQTCKCSANTERAPARPVEFLARVERTFSSFNSATPPRAYLRWLP